MISNFTIGEIADLLNITPKTIKHYHALGLVAQPKRDDNNYRLYTVTHITQLQQILHLKQFGLSLKQIEIIVQSENPDELVHVVLRQHATHIRSEIVRLQHQLDETQDFLSTEKTFSQSPYADKPVVSSLKTLSDALKSRSSSISDILIEVEQQAMTQLDQFEWDGNYELFWHIVGKQFMTLLTDEGAFIFWMERYLALATMEADDLQGKVWLEELRYSSMRQTLTNAFMPPMLSVLPQRDQQQILKLLPSLLYQEGAPLQQHFLRLLIKR